MGAAKLPSVCFQFPPALLFFVFSLGSDEEEFPDAPDDTGFTCFRSSLSLRLIFPQRVRLSVLFFPPFLSSLFPDPAAASSWSLCNSGRTFQLGTASLEDGVRRTSGRKTKKKCHVILHC